jgi:hypothetical protein
LILVMAGVICLLAGMGHTGARLTVAAQSTVTITSVTGIGQPQITVQAPQTGPASTYTWLLNGVEQGEETNRFKFDGRPEPCTDWVLNVEVRVSNSCQDDGMYASDTQQIIIPHQLAGCRTAGGAYPNPSTSSLTVDRPAEASPDAALTVRLFDAMSQERAGGTLTTQPLLLDLSALPAGIYYLHIMDGTQVLSREQIEVTH